MARIGILIPRKDDDGALIETMVMTYIILGIVAGLHRASYGAWKDAPYESFYLRRFSREIVIASIIGLLLFVFDFGRGEHLLVICLSIFTLSMIVTEIWKLFIRYKDESMYRIPVRIHVGGKAVESHIVRLSLAILFILIIYGAYTIGVALPETMGIHLKGVTVAFIITFAEAVAGAYKDGTIEGFKTITFLRSPALGILGGLSMPFLTSNLALILLGSVAFERIFIEVRKFFKKGYIPGKFNQSKTPYPKWLKKRDIFLIPYIFTWVIFIILLLIAIF